VLCIEACAESFDFVSATMFTRPQSDPCFTMSRPPPMMLRQPRQDPKILGEDSEAGASAVDVTSQLESRRQPRASNASLSSITVSRHPPSSSSLSQGPAPHNSLSQF